MNHYIVKDDTGSIVIHGVKSFELGENELPITQEQYIFLTQDDGYKYDCFYNEQTKEITRRIKEVIPVIPPTQEELTQQRLADLEIQQLEESIKAQTERQLLAQQLTDLELTILGGTI